MIKDKITPELKGRFKGEIKKSGETRKELGFLLCLDKEGGLYPSRTCEGDECRVYLWPALTGKDSCHREIQGTFHTHPIKAKLRDDAKEVLGYIPSDDITRMVLTNVIQQKAKNEGIDITLSMPSYSDILSVLGAKCMNLTKGTTCIGTDIEEDKVECWTAKEISKDNKKEICDKVINEYDNLQKEKREHFVPVKRWIKPLFDREIIGLNNTNQNRRK